ncbi:MAG: carbon-nitrogen hydrolase family protein [Candidatus Bathyarchaeia archaeon]
MESGVTPGTKPETFELDLGTVGFAICFDLNFEDVIKGLTKNGSELVFFPSMYPGGLQLRFWAFNYGVYVVSAYTGEGSMIVDPLGRVLATSSSYSPVICKTVNLDYGIFHIDYNHEKWDSIKRRYGSRVELDMLRPEAVFMLTSNHRSITVKHIAQEFQLETKEAYLRRATEIREKKMESLK